MAISKPCGVLVGLLVLAGAGSCSHTSTSPHPRDCDPDYEASLSILDVTNGKIAEERSVGWPSDQPLIKQDSQLLAVETRGDQASLTSWSPDLTREWSTRFADEAYAQAVEIHGTLVALTGERSISVISTTDGYLLWSRSFTGERLSPPLISGHVIVLPHGRDLSAFSAEDGGELWSRTFPSHPVTPVRMGDVVISGASRPSHGSKPGPLTALSLATGDVLWTSDEPPAGTSRPAVARSKGSLVDLEARLGGSGLDLVGVDPKTGAESWRRSFARRHLWDSVRPRSGRLLVQSRRDVIEIVDASTGMTETRLPAEGAFLFDWQPLDGDVVVSLRDGRSASVVRFTEKGDEIWRRTVEGDWLPRLKIGADLIYASMTHERERHGRLIAIDAHTGEIGWASTLDQPVVGRPLRLGSEVFILASDHRVGCV